MKGTENGKQVCDCATTNLSMPVVTSEVWVATDHRQTTGLGWGVGGGGRGEGRGSVGSPFQ